MGDEAVIYTACDTPIGELLVTAGEDGVLTGIHLPGRHPLPETRTEWRRDDDALAPTARQLEEYFAGARTEFDLALRLEGTAFERRVWDEVAAIPFGETATYGEIARRIGHPAAARAVGRANAYNPIPIVVPCHRVIGSNGTLTGYAGGLECKRSLLDLERDQQSLAA